MIREQTIFCLKQLFTLLNILFAIPLVFHHVLQSIYLLFSRIYVLKIKILLGIWLILSKMQSLIFGKSVNFSRRGFPQKSDFEQKCKFLLSHSMSESLNVKMRIEPTCARSLGSCKYCGRMLNSTY